MRPTRPQHPRRSARGRPRAPAARWLGADRRVPRPPSPFSAPRGMRPRPASRASSLTCGSGRRAEVSPGRARAPGQRLHPSHPAAPAALRAPPPRAGTRVFLLWAEDVPPAASGRAPSGAQVETAREAPPEGPSQPPSATAGVRGREWGAGTSASSAPAAAGAAAARLRPSPAPRSRRRRRRRGQEQE